MRYVFIAFFCLASLFLSAQTIRADRITFSRFDKPTDIALLDTLKLTLPAGTFKDFISNEKEVYSKAVDKDKFPSVNKLIDKLSRNGSDDISKCFYPRHSINFYKGGTLVKYVLICFECDGVRFSDERWVTRVRSEDKRLLLLAELKEYFRNEGLVEKGK